MLLKFMNNSLLVVVVLLFIGCRVNATVNADTVGKKLAIVFVSPSSVHLESSFGHIFLVIYSGEFPDFFSSAISFGGDLANLPRYELIKRGLTGKLPGRYRSQFFYEKFIEYSLMESRTMSFFEFNSEKIDLGELQRHVDEVKHAEFEYMFNSYNCTHGIDALINTSINTHKNTDPNIISPQGLVYKYR